MKKLAILATATALSACANTENQPKPEMVGVANPASEFCVKQGGKSEIRQDKSGNQYGVCILKDGKEVEEWEFFRQNNK